MEKQQSATFTIGADTPYELARLLWRIADALDEGGSERGGPVDLLPQRANPGATTGAAEKDWPPPSWKVDPSVISWYRHRAPSFLERLTPEAFRAVSFVAAHAPRVPVADLARELQKKPGPQLAGTLASIGYSWKALGAPQAPFRRVRTQYEMDPDLAGVLRDALPGAGRSADTHRERPESGREL